MRPVLVGFGPTVLPDLGLSASAAVQVEEHRWATTWFEAQLTRQFLDDSDLADDGNPPAGDWTQFRAGLLFTIPSTERRSWTARTGAVWFEARGRPNIVDEPGHHFGAYFALGFETRFGERWSMGPELALMPAVHEGGGGLELVPQATWRILWRL